ncbi:MAG: hypothetical protein EPN97_04255 [Alphaproteobacteria bacterium]|nr:MAG: hypothetical protein EPN97_04255 [Alphaproteobacteria bacterium]
MIKRFLPLMLLALLATAPASFAAPGEPQDILKGWDIISPDVLGLRISRNIDERAVTVETKWPTTICVTPVDLRDKRMDLTKVTFSAELKSSDLTGAAFLEMWLRVPGLAKGYLISRGYDRPLQKTSPAVWSKFETSFTLSKNQVPDQAILNLVINGKGTIFMRNVKFTRQP